MSASSFKLPVMETVKEAWDKVSGAKAAIWAVYFIMIGLRLIGFGVDYASKHELITNGIVMMVLGIVVIICSVVGMILNWGLIYLGVQRALGTQIRFSMVGFVFSWGLFFRMLGLFILMFLIFLPVIALLVGPTFGMAALFANADADVESNGQAIGAVITGVCSLVGTILGLFLLFRLYLAYALVIVKGLGPIDAIGMSFRATKSNVFRLFGLFIVNALIICLGIATLGIGLIWIIPYALINYGVVYRMLVEREGVVTTTP